MNLINIGRGPGARWEASIEFRKGGTMPPHLLWPCMYEDLPKFTMSENLWHYFCNAIGS